MFHRKNIVFVFILMFSIISMLSAAAYAMGGAAPSADQQKQGEQKRQAPLTADQVVSKMAIYLSLTDKQAQQIKPVVEEDMAKRSEIIKNDQGNRDAIKSAMNDLQIQTNNKLAQYLTDDQMKKLEDMQKAQQSQAGGRKGGGKRGGMGGGRGFGKMGF